MLCAKFDGNSLTTNTIIVRKLLPYFLPAPRSKRGNSYGNVSGWVAIWPGG